MQVPFDLATPRDLLSKTARELDVLRVAVASQDKPRIGDALYNFSVTAYHIKDWLIEHPSQTYTPQDVEDYANSSSVLKICRDLCNANKHRKITRGAPTVSQTTASAITSFTIADIRSFTDNALLGQPTLPFRVKVVMSDGTRLEVLQLAEEILSAWERFLVQHGL